jgi:hypothetical protein
MPALPQSFDVNGGAAHRAVARADETELARIDDEDEHEVVLAKTPSTR